jgi:hypothetical protein
MVTKARAAALVGLTRFQFYGRLKRYHIEDVKPDAASMLETRAAANPAHAREAAGRLPAC